MDYKSNWYKEIEKRFKTLISYTPNCFIEEDDLYEILQISKMDMNWLLDKMAKENIIELDKEKRMLYVKNNKRHD